MTTELTVSSRRVLRGLLLIVAGLMIAHAFAGLIKISPSYGTTPGTKSLVHLFHMNNEGNIPSWFSATYRNSPS